MYLGCSGWRATCCPSRSDGTDDSRSGHVLHPEARAEPIADLPRMTYARRRFTFRIFIVGELGLFHLIRHLLIVLQSLTVLSVTVLSLTLPSTALSSIPLTSTSLATQSATAINPDRLQAAAARLPRLQSLIISQGGEIAFEQYYAGRSANQPANLKSASKSVISALVGIAIDQGFIEGVDQPIADFFPEYRQTDLAATVNAITVGNLLTMQAGLASTSGRNYGRWVISDDWVESALRMPSVAAPGTLMIYSTGSTHILSAIIARATGMNTREFAQQYLASPLGFRLAYWSRDPKGVYFGGNDMEMTPRHMLAFGRLYLNGGIHNDTQLISADWVADSLMARATSPRGEGRFYGYGWWLRDMAGLQVPMAWGYGGQLIFVLPEFDMVIVATSDSTPDPSRRGHLGQLYDLIENQIIAPLLSATLTTATTTPAS